LNLNISVLLGMFCNYDAASISIPQLTYESFFHTISRIITNLAIYSWYDSYRTKERCNDTSSNHLQLHYTLTGACFSSRVSYRCNVLHGHMNV